MGGMIPLGDASRRPARIPIVTILIILVNALRFCAGADGWRRVRDALVGDARANCFRPSLDHDSDRDVHARQLVAHHRQHDLLMGLCPRDRRCDGPRAISCLLPGGRARGHACPGRGRPTFHGTQPGRERSNCRGDGRVSGHLSSRSDSHGFIPLCAFHESSLAAKRLLFSCDHASETRTVRPARSATTRLPN